MSILGLKHFVTTEIIHSINCSLCINHQRAYGGTVNEATKEFKAMGWVETDTHIVCPLCVARGRLQEGFDH